MTRIFNFAAGPSAMPLPVLEQAASEMTDWHGVGYSILEMSHRSKEFMAFTAKPWKCFVSSTVFPKNMKSCSFRAAVICSLP